LIFVLLIVFSAHVMADVSPTPCSCHYADKDYDPAKGYYFDRKSNDPLPKISYRMECLYVCSDKNNKLWRVSYVHSESRYGHKVGGVTHAKHFVCDLAIKRFIPIYDVPDHISMYEVELQGDFPSEFMNHRPSFKEWNDLNCQK
jgi:hypothetical protein